MTHSPLGLIAISGPDAEKFLQGQLTCDVHKINTQESQLGAYCNYQGRVQATFRLFHLPPDYYLLLPLIMVPPTLALLQKYALFSKVTLTNGSQNPAMAQLTEVDPQWELHNIQAGIATIYPETIGLFTPHMLNYDKLNGISFTKGCYMGQEIVARTHYLGHAKQHLYRTQITTLSTPQPGNLIYTHTQEQVGTVVNAARDSDHYELLVVLKDSVATETDFQLENQIVRFDKIFSC